MDRNIDTQHFCVGVIVALRKESVDRNIILPKQLHRSTSLSARRAWIEILLNAQYRHLAKSLSARRAWIEITAQTAKNTSIAGRSPQGERG